MKRVRNDKFQLKVDRMLNAYAGQPIEMSKKKKKTMKKSLHSIAHALCHVQFLSSANISDWIVTQKKDMSDSPVQRITSGLSDECEAKIVVFSILNSQIFHIFFLSFSVLLTSASVDDMIYSRQNDFWCNHFSLILIFVDQRRKLSRSRVFAHDHT